MPAVINVGGPVAWTLIVLVSAWAIRVGRAITGRKGAHHQENEDVTHDDNAPQPRFLQKLSATAIRMLIETGALPCAILELSADGAASSSTGAGSGRAQGGRDRAAAAGAAGSAAAAGAGSGAPARIVPPDLAAAVPCMSAASWVRALRAPEAWRGELLQAAAAAAAAAGAPCPAAPAADRSAAAARAAYTAAGSASGRELGATSLRARLQQQARLYGGTGGGGGIGNSSVSAGAAAGPLPGNGSGLGAAQPLNGLEPDGVGLQAGGAGSAAAAAAAAANMAALPYPPRHALLVVLGRNGRHVEAVAAAAAAAGYSRVATWVGGPEAFAATSLGGPRLPSLSRHGLWLLLQLGPEPLFHVPATVLDVRRPDERLGYGAIRGTVNVPADELAAALAAPPAEFARRYGCPPPSREGVTVLLSRGGRRAAWAAQLCVDAGLARVYVYEEGVYGWRFEDRVKPYRAYDQGALPPDPEHFAVEEPDEAAGLEELHALGMPLREGPRPSRFAVAAPTSPPGAPLPCPPLPPPRPATSSGALPLAASAWSPGQALAPAARQSLSLSGLPLGPGPGQGLGLQQAPGVAGGPSWAGHPALAGGSGSGLAGGWGSVAGQAGLAGMAAGGGGVAAAGPGVGLGFGGGGGMGGGGGGGGGGQHSRTGSRDWAWGR